MSLAPVDDRTLRRLLDFGVCPRCHLPDMVRHHVGEQWQGEALICIRNGCDGLTLYKFERQPPEAQP